MALNLGYFLDGGLPTVFKHSKINIQKLCWNKNWNPSQKKKSFLEYYYCSLRNRMMVKLKIMPVPYWYLSTNLRKLNHFSKILQFSKDFLKFSDYWRGLGSNCDRKFVFRKKNYLETMFHLCRYDRSLKFFSFLKILSIFLKTEGLMKG